MDKKEKDFDTMKWIRGVRDDMFKKYYKGDLTEYLKAISNHPMKEESKVKSKKRKSRTTSKVKN